jgi:3-oxoadipate enol-lactonase
MGANVTTTRIGPPPFLAVDHAGAGPLVLFLHGVGGNRGNWRDQIAALAPRYTAVAWDARGYGDSDDYAGPADFADFSRDVARVLDHFGAAQVHLVGLSMGGRIALDFAGRHPGWVASLVLADTSVARRGPEKIAQDTAELAVRKRPLLEEGKTPADIAPMMARRLVGSDVDAATLARIEASLGSVRTESYLKTLDAIAAYEGYPDFAAVAVPCLVLGGTCDPLAPPELLDGMAAALPKARRVTIPGAGHLSNIEQPDAFNAALLAFLEEQS